MYKTHRTEGSVVPVAVRHVSPKTPCCRKGRWEGNTGGYAWRAKHGRATARQAIAEHGQATAQQAKQSTGGRRPASDTRAGDGPASDSRARPGDGPASDNRVLMTTAERAAAP